MGPCCAGTAGPPIPQEPTKALAPLAWGCGGPTLLGSQLLLLFWGAGGVTPLPAQGWRRYQGVTAGDGVLGYQGIGVSLQMMGYWGIRVSLQVIGFWVVGVLPLGNDHAEPDCRPGTRRSADIL